MNEARQAVADVTRAERARELIDNPLHQEAFIALKAAAFEDFSNSEMEDEKLRFVLWQRMQVINDFQKHFENILAQGEVAKDTLSMLEQEPNHRI